MVGVARFDAHFDSECDICFAFIWQGDPMAYDRVDQQYICDNCADNIEYESSVDCG